MTVSQSFCPRVGGGGSYMNIAHDVLDLTVQGRPPATWDLTVQGPLPPARQGNSLDMETPSLERFKLVHYEVGTPSPPPTWHLIVEGPRHHPPRNKTSLHRHSQTCSNLFIKKHVQLASGRFASYWNVFLLSMSMAMVWSIVTHR